MRTFQFIWRVDSESFSAADRERILKFTILQMNFPEEKKTRFGYPESHSDMVAS